MTPTHCSTIIGSSFLRRDSMRSNTSEDGKDRPGSGNKKGSAAQAQKKHLNNTLKVPSVGGIKLPSDSINEIDV